MQTDKQSAAVANLVLRMNLRRERLREIVYQTGYRYYLGSTMIAQMVAGAIYVGIVIRLFNLKDASIPLAIIFVMALIAFWETQRQNARFNALLELMEVEKRLGEIERRNEGT